MNGVSERDVKASKFIIYAHVCRSGTYIGLSKDPVKRWQQHCLDAANQRSKYYDDAFKVAIRAWKSGFKHYVLAVANFEMPARNKEASAIHFYEATLNTRPEYPQGERDYGFRPISAQVGIPLVLEKRSGTSGFVRTASSRKPIVAEIVFDSGRKRVVCSTGQAFPAGLYVECARSERERFQVGERVRVSVALAEDGKYLVAARTSKLVKVS